MIFGGLSTIIAGTRTITNQVIFDLVIKNSSLLKNTEVIISGGAEGVDTMAAEYARYQRIRHKLFKANWCFGNKAGPMRNLQMSKIANALVVLWDGQSDGTADMLNKWANRRHINPDDCEIYLSHGDDLVILEPEIVNLFLRDLRANARKSREISILF